VRSTHILTGFRPVKCFRRATAGGGDKRSPACYGFHPKIAFLGAPSDNREAKQLSLSCCIFRREPPPGKALIKNRNAMKTIWKSILTATVILPGAGTAFAQNQPLTCWYDDHADFTSADSAPAGATIGSVVKARSGDKTYSYTISARDGTACPVQLPLATKTATTVALVRQDDGSCTNDNVADTGSAVLAGSATVSPETSATSTAAIRLAGCPPTRAITSF